MTLDAARTFLLEAARYFEARPTNGEDAAHWANVYNADNCRQIADLLRDSVSDPQGENAGTAVECEASQSGGATASPTSISETPHEA